LFIITTTILSTIVIASVAWRSHLWTISWDCFVAGSSQWQI